MFSMFYENYLAVLGSILQCNKKATCYFADRALISCVGFVSDNKNVLN